ncbi:MAG: hypothetical protein PGN33_21990 [Methylobacterium radiotolerans]
MRITLWPVPADVAAAGVPVGYIGTSISTDLTGRDPQKAMPVLSYVGRQPLVDGREVNHKEVLGEPLAAEVERISKRLFGTDYVAALSAATGLNVRSLQRGRIVTHGLPVPILLMLGRAVATPCHQATGYALLAAAAMWDALLPEYGVGEQGPGPMSAQGRELLEVRMREISERAVETVAEMREEAAAAKARAYAAAGRIP